MNEHSNSSAQVLDPQLVIDSVLAISKLTWEQMLSKSRKQDIVMARQVLSVFLKIYSGWSDRAIAEKLNKERSNIHTCRMTVRNMIDTYNQRYTNFCEQVEQHIISHQLKYPNNKP